MDNLGSPEIWGNLLTQKVEAEQDKQKKSREKRQTVLQGAEKKK